jgi:hypothetical protein
VQQAGRRITHHPIHPPGHRWHDLHPVAQPLKATNHAGQVGKPVLDLQDGTLRSDKPGADAWGVHLPLARPHHDPREPPVSSLGYSSGSRRSEASCL